MKIKEIPTLAPKDSERFWSNINKSTDPNGCWIWTGPKFNTGYGCLSIGVRRFLAHRISHVIHGGDFSAGPEVLHGPCNDRLCCNPAHLSSGTRQNNEADKKRDGTTNDGERNGHSKLSASDVAEIRRRYAAGGVSQQRIATEYGVDQSLISYIVRRQNWKQVA